jgi:tetratricopeptide (TPR) repeat protein
VVDVHRVVQAVIRSHLPGADHQHWVELTIRLLLEAFPSSIEDLAAPARWPLCEQLLPHIFAAARHAEAGKVATAETGELLMHLGSYLQHRGEYAEARSLFERALVLVEHAYGRDHFRVAHVLNALAYVLRAQEMPADAQTAHERALRIINGTSPLDDRELGRTLNNLGRVIFDQRDCAGARFHLELDDLAKVRDAMGDPTGAESARQRAQGISQALLAGRRRARRSID